MASTKSIGHRLDIMNGSIMQRVDIRPHPGSYTAMTTESTEQKALQRANIALMVSFVTVVAITCAFMMHVAIMQRELTSLRVAVSKCSDLTDPQDLSMKRDRDDDFPLEKDLELEEEFSQSDDFEDFMGEEEEREEEDFESPQIRARRSPDDSKDKTAIQTDKVENPVVQRKARKISPRHVMHKLESLKKIVMKERRSRRKKREAQEHTGQKNIAVQLYGDAYRNISRVSLATDEFQRAADGGKLTRFGYVAPRINRQDVIKMWRKEDWVSSDAFEYSSSSGTLKVKHKGIYIIYAQLLFFSSEGMSGYAIMRKKGSSLEPLTKCLTSVTPSSQNVHRANVSMRTCATNVMAKLNAGDLLSLEIAKHGTENPTVLLNEHFSHWGLHQLYPVG